MIDRPTIERILAAADIVGVVSEFVTLKKAGTSYKGLCPFHDDRTPSFSVSPAKNYCHCFSCGKGGTPVGFIMEHLQMTYPEALRWLAKKYNIEIQEKEMTSEEREKESERESIFIVNEWAAKYYQDILYNDVDGRAIGMQYFRSRGFRDDIIQKFRLGFALDDRHALPREAIRKGYKAEFLLKSGICYAKEGEEKKGADALSDRFHGRAIFPWISQSGKVVAFGGRKLDKATKGVQQKYVNSPETAVYHKASELYGIYQAKKAISKEDCVYMVEGYTDVISMHQCGIENVVANSGTALSHQQIHILRRYTKNIVLLYDGDAAGQKATERGTDMLLEDGMNIKIMLFPEGDDPDSFARKNTPEQFKEYILSHQTDFIQFRITTMLSSATDPVKRGEMISSVVKSISLIPDPITRTAYLQDCASRLHMSEATLTTRMNAFIVEAKKEKEKTARIEQGRLQNQGYQQQNSGYQQNQGKQAFGNQQYNGYKTVDNAQQNMNNNAQGTNELPPEFLPDDAFSPPQQNSSTLNGQLGDTNRTNGMQQGGSNFSGQQATGNYFGQHYRPQSFFPQISSFAQASALNRAMSKSESIEKDIIREVVRYGERIIKNDVATEDGQTVSLTLAEYVFYNMQCDNLHFHNPIYTTILEEAMERSQDITFRASDYFSRHPDINISQTAAALNCDQYVLSKSLEMKVTDEFLLQHLEHLLLALRRDIVDVRLAEILKEIGKGATNPDSLDALMKEYKQLNEISNSLSKKLGKSLR